MRGVEKGMFKSIIEIQFSEAALELRGAVNIAIFVFCGVLAFLFGRFAWTETRQFGYRNISWLAKGGVGLCLVCLGEMARSGTIWEILRYQGVRGNYLSDIVPLMIALLLITIGSACAIRVFTPERWGSSVWIGSTLVVFALIVGNWLFL